MGKQEVPCINGSYNPNDLFELSLYLYPPHSPKVPFDKNEIIS